MFKQLQQGLSSKKNFSQSEVAKKVAQEISKEKEDQRITCSPDYTPPTFIDEIQQGASKDLELERSLLEDNLVRLLLEHGESILQIETSSEEDEEPISGCNICGTFNRQGRKQQIVLEDPSTEFILSRFRDSLDNGEIPATESFFNGTDS